MRLNKELSIVHTTQHTTAQTVGSTLTYKTDAWFDIRIKKRRTKEAVKKRMNIKLSARYLTGLWPAI